MPKAAARALPPPSGVATPRPDILGVLVAHGLLAADDARAVASRVRRSSAGLRAHLVATGRVRETAFLAAASVVHGAPRLVDPADEPPDPALVRRVSPVALAEHGLLPWRAAGGTTVVLASDPDAFDRARPMLHRRLGRVRPAFAPRAGIEAALTAAAGPALSARAEASVALSLSCRGLAAAPLADTGLILTFALATSALLWPVATLAALVLWATLTLIVVTALRAAAAVAQIARPDTVRPAARPLRPPVVTLFVPLFRETEIATHLLARLARLTYPPECLDICLVVEATDLQTQQVVAATALPPHVRVTVVPASGLQTKPRALNYALPFAEGSIVGVLDAEDWPAPDQIERVVERFHAAPDEVACLQGVLDFYNARQNWLSRCFAVDYATWFRIVLPGLARMGFVIPLGGTTVYFRRAALDAMGGWDAWNVTEDADLGLRLARYGYRTELIATVTREEANCRAWPWVKQRSRWLKGYAITLITHLRRPARLVDDLGPWKALGVLALFGGTLSQFLLAPVLWSFWLPLVGLPHPLADALPPGVLLAGVTVFVVSELVTIAVAMIAVRAPSHRWLMPWVPSLMAYWPLGTVAAAKAFLELVRRPFHWDKTAHGVSAPDEAASPAPTVPPPALPPDPRQPRRAA